MCFKCDQPREIENIRRHVSPQLADDISFLTKWILLADCMHLVPVSMLEVCLCIHKLCSIRIHSKHTRQMSIKLVFAHISIG